MPAEIEKPVAARPATRGGTRWAAIAGFLALLVFVALFAAGYLPRRAQQRTLAAESREAASEHRRVHVVPVKRAPARSSTVLPGSMQAIDQISIFARADGYLKRRLVDIGDRVTAGQLVAELETPELDQQIRQARASLEQTRAAATRARAALGQSQANLELASVTLKRWKVLVARGVLAQQEGDQKQSDFDARQADVRAAEAAIKASDADVAAAEANVQRLLELQSFSKVTAPFAGVITARNVDTGTLISSGSGANSRQLYDLARIDRLRIYVNVPQAYAPAVRTGQPADVLIQEFPGVTFHGSVTRTANSLDEKTRTLLTEVQVSNSSGRLLPGMYAQVGLVLERATPPVLAPADTLMVRSDGSYVAAVGRDGAVELRRVMLGRDYGVEVEVVSGLDGSERLIANPRDDLKPGEIVEVESGGALGE